MKNFVLFLLVAASGGVGCAATLTASLHCLFHMSGVLDQQQSAEPTPNGTVTPGEPSDLLVDLRSATGSNTFQVGEQIPLEAAVSSSTPNKYLEPCELFNDSIYGVPRCRFLNKWSFSIVSGRGWVDPKQDVPLRIRTGTGRQYDVPNRVLSAQPAVFQYMLTKQFRFKAPGEYRVQVAMNIGLNDETTQLGVAYDPANPPHSVGVVRELTIHIVPARAEWQDEVVRKGVEAFLNSARGGIPIAEAPGAEQAREALCNLGTPEAARALVRVLSRNDQGQAALCLEKTPSRAAAVDEIQRLIADPDAGITPQLFRLLIILAGRERFGSFRTDRALETELKEKLMAALPGKQGQARIGLLLTVLANPKNGGKGEPFELPFAPQVIALTKENFDRLPEQSRHWLMDEGWDRVRSPIMLPVVRSMASAGDGNTLLRWLELDAEGASAFVRAEIVRPEPRFSSFYLRVPDEFLPREEARIAANFLAAGDRLSMARSASLLHRYATKAVLPAVLPFIDQKWTRWERSVRLPIMAYLLKVSPEEAERRVRSALAETEDGSTDWLQSLFTDLGTLQPGPVLERLALETIGRGPGIAAADAARYLQRYGRAEVKPLIREQWNKWNHLYVESGARQRYMAGTVIRKDYELASLVQALRHSFVSAQAWVLSTKDLDDVRTTVGTEETKELGYGFIYAGSVAVPDSPRQYIIYGGANRLSREDSMDYLNSVERLQFAVNQYKCGSIDELKRKLLQFPAVATFYLAPEFTRVHRETAADVAEFLHQNGYQVGGAPE